MSCKQSEWSTCPQDVLARCVASQPDPRDGAAAACVCKFWRQAYVSFSYRFELDCTSLRSWPVPGYLSQFQHIVSVLLRGGAEWGVMSNWLIKDEQLTVPAEETARRRQLLISSIPSGCEELILDTFCPDGQLMPRQSFSSPSFTFAHLPQLRCLTIQEIPELFPLASLQSLQNLEALALRGKVIAGMGAQTLRFEEPNGLELLPQSLTKLQLQHCNPFGGVTAMEQLMHLVCLQDLEISHGECVLRLSSEKLPLLTRLSLNRATELTGEFFEHLSGLSTLQVLNLSQFRTHSDTCTMGALLSAVPNLQELDIVGCTNLELSPVDCGSLKLALFSFHYDQLKDPQQSYFQHFMQDDQQCTRTCAKPLLRMVSGFVALSPTLPWLDFLPPAALTHLHVTLASRFPWLYSSPNASALQLLTVLDVTFDNTVDRQPIRLDSKCVLHELYLCDGRCEEYDLAQVTSLVKLGITHWGQGKPKLTLPPHLTWLCLHNTLAASLDPNLTCLEELCSLKLGGRVAGANISRKLPCLPPSLVSLDLWDGLITDLQELTRLTDLKRLVMPEPPDQQQMSVIKRLRQLRRLDITTRQGECCLWPSTVDQYALLVVSWLAFGCASCAL